jgi:hypothetical protein
MDGVMETPTAREEIPEAFPFMQQASRFFPETTVSLIQEP